MLSVCEREVCSEAKEITARELPDRMSTGFAVQKRRPVPRSDVTVGPPCAVGVPRDESGHGQERSKQGGPTKHSARGGEETQPNGETSQTGQAMSNQRGRVVSKLTQHSVTGTVYTRTLDAIRMMKDLLYRLAERITKASHTALPDNAN